ncbi:hypothetical protein LPN04_29400 [Rugamonas sp. A1-17]|nr:hypothetical protein [Rugamonas sp. A1-17]
MVAAAAEAVVVQLREPWHQQQLEYPAHAATCLAAALEELEALHTPLLQLTRVELAGRPDKLEVPLQVQALVALVAAMLVSLADQVAEMVAKAAEAAETLVRTVAVAVTVAPTITVRAEAVVVVVQPERKVVQAEQAPIALVQMVVRVAAELVRRVPVLSMGSQQAILAGQGT